MLKKLSSFQKELISAVIFFTAVSILVFAPVLTGSFIYAGDYTGSDLLDFNLPIRHAAAEILKSGSIPVWSKLIGNGFPLLEEGQAGVFYPSTLPLFALFSVPAASDISIISSIIIAALGGYFFARANKLSIRASVFSAVTFAFSPIVIFRLKHLNMLQSIVWLPLTLTCIKLICDEFYEEEPKYKILPICGLASAWGMQILAGHPHITCVCGVSCIIYALVLTVSALIQKKFKSSIKHLKIIAVSIILSAVLGVSLSSAQTIPTLNLALNSSRGHSISIKTLKLYPFKLSHLQLLFNPYLFENPADRTGYRHSPSKLKKSGVFWESMPYFGLIGLGLIIPSFWHKDKKQLAAVSASAVIMLIMALGPDGFLYLIPWKLLPGFNMFRFPARFLIPFGCFAALWAGMGFDAAFNFIEKKNKKYAVCIFTLLTAAALFDLAKADNKYIAYLPADLFKKAPEAAEALKSDNVSRIASFEFQSLWWKKVRLHGWKKASKQVEGIFRCLALNSGAFWNIADHNSRVAFEGGMNILEFAQIQKLQRDLIDSKSDKNVLSEQARLLYSLQNVSHLLSVNDWKDEHGSLLPSKDIKADGLNKDLKIYKINEPKPRLRLIPGFRFVPAESSAEDFLEKYEELLKDESMCLVNEPESEAELCEASSDLTLSASEHLNIISEKDSSITAECRTEKNRILYLNDNFSKNWSASLDGKKMPVYKAGYCFTACIIPAGEHTVTISYSPKYMTAGMLLTLLSAVLICAAAYSDLKKNA